MLHYLFNMFWVEYPVFMRRLEQIVEAKGQKRNDLARLFDLPSIQGKQGLIQKFNLGEVSEEEFFSKISEIMNLKEMVSTPELIDAWNAVLVINDSYINIHIYKLITQMPDDIFYAEINVTHLRYIIEKINQQYSLIPASTARRYDISEPLFNQLDQYDIDTYGEFSADAQYILAFGRRLYLSNKLGITTADIAAAGPRGRHFSILAEEKIERLVREEQECKKREQEESMIRAQAEQRAGVMLRRPLLLMQRSSVYHKQTEVKKLLDKDIDRDREQEQGTEIHMPDSPESNQGYTPLLEARVYTGKQVEQSKNIKAPDSLDSMDSLSSPPVVR